MRFYRIILVTVFIFIGAATGGNSKKEFCTDGYYKLSIGVIPVRQYFLLSCKRDIQINVYNNYYFFAYTHLYSEKLNVQNGHTVNGPKFTLKKEKNNLYLSSDQFYLNENKLENVNTEKANTIMNMAYIDYVTKDNKDKSCPLNRKDIMNKITYQQLEREPKKFIVIMDKIIAEHNCEMRP
ncbi:MAG: hypothetical protein ABUK01_10095 [Leptospirales bacterium]